MSAMGTVANGKTSPLCVPNPIAKVKNLDPATRLLCGPGPSNAHPRVHAAMSLPQVGHMDPNFLGICEDVKELLRYVWQTNNAFTIPVSGTGSAAWEAAVANLTEPGDIHLVCVNGYFGERHCDMASRYGADVRRLDKEWGRHFTLEEVKEALQEHRPKLLWICYAETSTGVRQPLEGFAEACHDVGCLFMVDTVTAMGGVPIKVDEMGIDVAYAGTQKCLSCPPGVAPVTFNAKALEVMAQRKSRVANWYLDMSMIRKYIFAEGGGPRVYHHTAPISMIYALREALTLIAEEGLEETWKRHQETAEYFWNLMDCMGFEMFVKDKKTRLTSLHTVVVPQDIDPAKAIKYCREMFNIEVGGGMGSLAGKVFRIGLMGYNSRKEVALLVATALKAAIDAQRN